MVTLSMDKLKRPSKFVAILSTVSAVGNWHLYVQRYVKYEVEQRPDRERSVP